MYNQPENQGRSASFQDGAQVGSINTATTMQSQVPTGFHPDSVLQPISMSGNGMSSKDAGRQLLGGQQLPSSNGMSAGTYQQKQPLMNQTRSV